MAEATGGSQGLEGRWEFVVVDVEENSMHLLVVALPGQFFTVTVLRSLLYLINPMLRCINREPDFYDECLGGRTHTHYTCNSMESQEERNGAVRG
jgi:hypothetical protein